MRTLILAVSILVLIVGLPAANADGVFLMKQSVNLDPKSYAQDITEPLQKALIVYDKGVEQLILQVSYKGSASEFAWLVPTPSRPQVSKVDAPIFHMLHSITAPEIRYWFDADKRLRGIYVGKGALGAPGAGAPAGLDVNVLEERQVGVYDIAVLRAGNAGDLVQWLKQNSYQITPKLVPVLSDYIRRGWVFTAMRINTGQQDRVAGRLAEGVLQSLSFKFSTPELVYPLKVSSLNKDDTEVLLYVIAEHRVEEPLMTTECSIGYDNYTLYSFEMQGMSLPEWPSTRITKLTATFSPEQMTRDLVLKPAQTDDILPVEDVSPPFLDNLGASSLLLIDNVLPYPQSLVALGIAGLITLTPFGRRRWRLWIAAGTILVIVGLMANGRSFNPWVAYPFDEDNGYAYAGTSALAFLGTILACIVLFSLRARLRRGQQ